MNEDQESEMQSIEEKFTEENSLQFHPVEVSFNTLDEFVARSAYVFQTPIVIL